MDSRLPSKCDHSSYRYIEKVKKPDRNLSREITHPLHRQHRLQLGWRPWGFICDKCLYISAADYGYSCVSCDFRLDLACASSASGTELPKDEEPLRFKDGKRKTIQHYSHAHKLSFFKYRKIHEQDLDCFWCEKHLSVVCYGCTKCRFYLHSGCSDKIPRTLAHHFHIPGHTLRLSSTLAVAGDCFACKRSIYYSKLRYIWEKCIFHLHLECAKLLPTLKLACHPHRLAYFRGTSKLDCRTCGKHCGGDDSICRCVQCDISFHLKCVVPSEATSKYHKHPLILTKSVKEDDSDEFCCDVCENERDPKHPVYYCQSCTFVAHIQCLLPDVDEDQITSSMETRKLCMRRKWSRMKGVMASTLCFDLSSTNTKCMR
ncbi:hypothetical protein F3Y22_tig00110478pilonHSYRG00250 [Hibiscus syriacus]|uniref:DC1 domain-containing protein n=1 Tax=Hibiscus syriacus TaxID=106335 RepID=A0A6A3AJF9_HIBSY|nr:hypothetical protein F3Y22_tig00110478pilonHSYRG00250 [Hibiscus syriacus]